MYYKEVFTLNLFGIPLYISYDFYLNFLNENFINLILSDDTIYITYIIVNCFYIVFIFFLICILYKFIVTIINKVFR